jgi:hypothetical protein
LQEAALATAGLAGDPQIARSALLYLPPNVVEAIKLGLAPDQRYMLAVIHRSSALPGEPSAACPLDSDKERKPQIKPHT